MTKIILDLEKSDDLQKVNGQWKFAPGLVPREPNEGLTAQIAEMPARLADYDDSNWEICTNLRQGRSKGFTFGWYRIAVTLPQKVDEMEVAGAQVWFETCVDDYGEVWVDGKCDLATGLSGRGAISGFNTPQRVLVTDNAQPGAKHVIAVLAINGPLAQPIGGIFLRYGRLSFEKS